jgi:hypothetical protein
MPMVVNNGTDTSKLEGLMGDVARAIQGQDRMKLVIDERGIYAIVSHLEHINNLTQTRASR